MDEEQTPTIKEVMDGMRAVNEMMSLFALSGKKLAVIMPMFQQAVGGNAMSWIQGISAVGDLDLDDAHGCLIVALSALCQVLDKLEDSEGQALLEALKTGKKPMAQS